MIDPIILDRIEDEAADWAILLADDPDNEAQLQRFHQWLGTSSVHAEVWERTRRAFDLLGKLPATTVSQWPSDSQQPYIANHKPTQLVSSVKQESTAQFVQRKKGFAWKRPLVGMAVAASLVLGVAPKLSLYVSSDYITASGEQKVYTLSDGTSITLAPESALDVEYSNDLRLVKLKQGVAFFEVHRNVHRPFIVEANGTRTTVLGTAFNVDIQHELVVVDVEHGHVRVENHSGPISINEDLEAGDGIVVNPSKGATLTHHLPENIARWRRGELVVYDLPVKEVVESFRRYYSGMIVVTEPFASQRVTGFYNLSDPVSTLTAMAQSQGVSTHQISPWLLVLGE